MREMNIDLENAVIAAVEESSGLRLFELVSRIPVDLQVGEHLIQLIDKMIEDKKLASIEYAVPESPWRIRKFILPAHTQIHISGMRKELDTCLIGVDNGNKTRGQNKSNR